MIWLLDTNVCVCYLNGRSRNLKRKLDATTVEHIVVCSIVKAELFFGVAKCRDPAETLADQRRFLSRFQSLPFDDAAASFYGNIRADLAQRGMPIGDNDIIIAAICLANDVTLVTHNSAEFGRVNGLRIEDWEA
jgi:tRNA(fMet)-specific endonuclease VapC